jgi:hypothetical protein
MSSIGGVPGRSGWQPAGETPGQLEEAASPAPIVRGSVPRGAPGFALPKPADACGPDSCATATRPPVVHGASAVDYMDTTGPLATPLGRKRAASIELYAVPGASIEVRDDYADDGAGPKLLLQTTATPDPGGKTYIDEWKQQNGIFTDTSRLVPGATMQVRPLGSSRLTEVTVPPEDQWGLVKVNVNLPPDADWQVGDRLKIAERAGTRGVSAPVVAELTDGRGGSGVRRAPFAFGTRMSTFDEQGSIRVTATCDRAIPPGAYAQLFFNGEPVGDPVQADERGRFSVSAEGCLTAGDWEVGVAFANGSYPPTLVPLSCEKVPDLASRIAAKTNEIREQLRRLPENCTLPIDISGLPRGYTVTVNDAASGTTTRLVADENGRICTRLQGIAPGDMLSVTFDDATQKMDVLSQWSSFRVPKLAVAVPASAADAARNAAIDCAIAGFTMPSQALATVLFGPYGPGKDFQGDYAAALRGALIGITAQGTGAEVIDHVSKNGSEAMKQGLSWGLAYRGDIIPRGLLTRAGENPRPPLDPNADIGLRLSRRGARSIVPVGGYDMLHPDRSAPLAPAIMTQPSTFELATPGLPPLTFNAGGYTPPNINHNAIVFTMEWDGLTPG